MASLEGEGHTVPSGKSQLPLGLLSVPRLTSLQRTLCHLTLFWAPACLFVFCSAHWNSNSKCRNSADLADSLKRTRPLRDLCWLLCP